MEFSSQAFNLSLHWWQKHLNTGLLNDPRAPAGAGCKINGEYYKREGAVSDIHSGTWASTVEHGHRAAMQSEGTKVSPLGLVAL